MDCVKLLCEAKAEVNLLNKRFTPVHLAVKGGSLDLLTYLVDSAKAKVSKTTKSGQYPLHLACYGGSLPLVKFLLAKKGEVRVNQQTSSEKETPLHSAAQQGHLPVVEYLVTTAKADVEIENYEEKMAADVAEDYEHMDIANYLRNVLSERALNALMDDLGVEEPKGGKKAKKKKFKPTPAADGEGSNTKKGKGKKGKKGKGGGKKPSGGPTVAEPAVETKKSSYPSVSTSVETVDEDARGGGGMKICDTQPIRITKPTPAPKKRFEESSDEESSDDEVDFGGDSDLD